VETAGTTGIGEERRRSGRALRILIADDERDTVATLTAIFETEGHVVQGVFSGADVLPAARLSRPDAVILDISVPGISGYGVAQAIRQSFTDIRRPLLIAISGMWKELPDQQIARQAGFDHYLVKPCDPAQLLALVASLKHQNRP
jgi:DNA-binding response OmpR family regulator